VKLRPFHLVIGAGVALGGVVAVSGLVPVLVEWHDDSEVTREVLGNVPGAWRLVFYVTLAVLFVYAAYLFATRVKNWERGAPDRRETNRRTIRRRLEDVRAGLYMQTLMRDPQAGLMHSLIYWSFLVLFAVTTVLEINHQLPPDLKFLHGDVYRAYSFVGDAAGVVFIAGVLWAFVRRYVQRPYRIASKSRPEHAAILVVFLAIGVTGFLAEGFRIALDGNPSFEQWAFVGYPVAQAVDGLADLEAWHRGAWLAHVVAFVAFVIMLPVTMLRHMFTAPVNMYLRSRERPKGAMRPLPNLMETELETFGASTVEDFTWKQLLDTDSCTMCGRCTSVCPAHATGKPLDPREIVLKVGEVMAATGTPPTSPPIGVDREITVSANSVFERITAEELWACTSCKACDEICPVNIEILDKILDMRRYLSLMESNFPTELGTAYRAMENASNPWNMNQAERGDWAAALDNPVPVVSPGEAFEHEYLYWVGCAGSFDDKNRKVTVAVAKLLQRAGVDFAILGPAEMCNGDPARRSGNEYLFQMLAGQNVENLNGMGVKKVITQCPHCFNTLANEYPQLGGDYEVVHHSEFIEWLVDSGRLDMSRAALDDRIVYHDSCYLGRHNDIYLAPRRVIGSIGGIEVVEAPRNGNRGMCCGAGGARMWMEENVGSRVNEVRSRELLATRANRIATACPFCYVMIDDGVKAEGVEDDEVRVSDIAVLLVEALERGESEPVMPHSPQSPPVTVNGALMPPVTNGVPGSAST
jgi:Fe-S oxidoreductase/nitrate reductase gamma subunit